MEYLLAICVVLLIIFIAAFFILLDRYRQKESMVELLREDFNMLNEDFKSLQKDHKRLKSLKKSSEVRLGMISERLAPFLDGFDYDPMNVVFLGRPIDYIHFGDDAITFVEVKSGKSQLSKRQRQIRDMINEGNINWDEFTVD